MEVVTSGFCKCSSKHLKPCQRLDEWDSVFGGMLAYMAFKFSDSKLSLLGFHYIINYFYQALRCLRWARHMLWILFLGCVGTAVLVLFSCVWAIGLSGMMIFLFYNINVCDPAYPNIIHCQLSVTIAVDSADRQNVLFCYLSPVPRTKGARWIWWQTLAWPGMCIDGQANPAMPFSKEVTLMWLWRMQSIQIELSATWEILTGYPWNRKPFYSYGVQIWPHAWRVRSHT